VAVDSGVKPRARTLATAAPRSPPAGVPPVVRVNAGAGDVRVGVVVVVVAVVVVVVVVGGGDGVAVVAGAGGEVVTVTVTGAGLELWVDPQAAISGRAMSASVASLDFMVGA
jgi:hypothetical protein